MEMTYDGALVMPANFVVVNEEEMMYIDGGLNAWQRCAVVGAVVVVGAALTAAIISGSIWLAAKLMGVTVKVVATQIGATQLCALVSATLGLSYGACWTVAKYITNS